jgi:tRNA pseudouridine38-40 synthase
MDKNFKLTIEYDGTHYHGWQIQPNGPSIQQAIESAINTMTHQQIRLLGSGRTDAGVHAIGQVANFICETRISDGEFQKGLNSLLPDDIVIRNCIEVPLPFHARYDAKSKLYRYSILNQPIAPAIERLYVWWLRAPLDLNAMQEAAAHLIGRHDFKAFEGAGSPRSSTVRHVMHAQLFYASPGPIRFEIKADGFLRYMVRNIVGTLVAVGRGEFTPEQFQSIMASCDRKQAAATAPPQGLFLVQVDYE